ncbi:YqzL family protein [Salibacterium salarium]|uniref:YqzL family protein n=1 Tax=Salibacterium salarium TaxID=284579 RepID=A0A3R9QHU9_9BACI|nr:YqzL family protein [Salibacterium salarium]RSL30966.1 YqzL family protein [Salibacterium salarium]
MESNFSSWDLFILTGNVDAYLLTKELEQSNENYRYDGEDYSENTIE